LFCLTSNFQHQKLEAKQKNFVRPFLKTKAPKLKGFKNSKISSHQFSQCNFWYLFNLISLNSMFCKTLLIPRVHLQRYIWFFPFHIMSSNYASYFISHLIISYMFHDLWKVLEHKFNGKMFYVCDNNHWLQAEMPYISRVHLDDLSRHIAMDSIMLDMREGLIHLLITITNMNK
jgi:hypothetical protein